MNAFEQFVAAANAVVWSDVLIYLLLGAGIYFSLRLRFFQVRLFKSMIREMWQGEKSAAGISSFQALAVSKGGHRQHCGGSHSYLYWRPGSRVLDVDGSLPGLGIGLCRVGPGTDL
jgi:hypothetical protein